MSAMRIWGVAACVAMAVCALAGEPAGAQIKVLVVSGGHPFQEEPFLKMFKDNPDITFTAAKQEKSSEAYDRDDLLSYDVVVLYDFLQGITDAQKGKLLSLFDKGAGLVVLHHALANYQAWPEFERIAGGKFLLAPETKDGATIPASGTGGGELNIHVVSKDHPVTAGMDDFKLQDEYYNKCRVSPDATLLLTTDNPGNQREVAWCHDYRKSRVFYIMSGHDQKVYDHPSYRRLLANALRWAARK